MRLIWAIVLVILDFVLVCVNGIPIDNGVQGDPEITCAPSYLGVKFHTKNPFGGHIYAKGRYAETACRIDGDHSPQNTANIAIAFDTCGVRRMRSVNPKGILMTATVLIMFHTRFMTKVDRAYYVQCFYMESDQTVTAALDVSMLTTTSILSQAPMPACRYQVLDGKDGQPIRYAKVGDPVHHRWSCDASVPGAYCMVVHTCFVDDGSGNTVTLIDSEGCAQDQFLLGNLEYYDDLTVGRESHVFKYADKPTVSFNCQISVAPKQQGLLCPRPYCTTLDNGPSASTISPPPLSQPTRTPAYSAEPFHDSDTTSSTLLPAPPAWVDRNRRFQRSSSKHAEHQNETSLRSTLRDDDSKLNLSSSIIDVDTQPILVLDVDSRLEIPRLDRLIHDKTHSSSSFDGFCIPKFLFSICFCAGLIVIIVSCVILSLINYNRFRRLASRQLHPPGLSEVSDGTGRKQVFDSMYHRFFTVRVPRSE